MPVDLSIAIWITTWAAIGFGFIQNLNNSNKLTLLRGQFTTLVALLGEKIARVLHSPHTPELDALLEKVETHQSLSDEDRSKLLALLHQSIVNSGGEKTKDERTMAAILFALLAIRDNSTCKNFEPNSANSNHKK